MPASSDFRIDRLRGTEVAVMESLLTLFGEVFGEPETYCDARPSQAYLRDLLDQDHFIALVARQGGEVVGGLAAYVLQKFEQERNEIFIYDLAVAAAHRRKGIATALIGEVKNIAAACGAYLVFVQADRGDAPAIALYSKLGLREDVHHFDIAVART